MILGTEFVWASHLSTGVKQKFRPKA